ncbi:MAG: hypothetical protein FJZ63_04240, partial [Chlamydiae bacterium]|nr:hypothetical protein [Chlamydiota bacterium]
MEDIRWSREETWNKWEKIPFVNFAAGGFRAFAGGVGQVILSVALMAIYAIGNLFTLGYFNLGRRSLKQSLYAVHGL